MKDSNNGSCGEGCACSSTLPRRDFLKAAAILPVSAFAAAASREVMAGPFEPGEPLDVSDKKLDAKWVKSLTERGTPTVYQGAELDKIGMPIGGIGAGQLYLGGDGKLWHWDIFNIPHGTGDGGYAHPRMQESPIEQGFAVRVNGKTHRLDKTGFADIEFAGQYPIAEVTYRDAACPVKVKLEAFSPFIPLNAEDSSLPATILNYTFTNSSKAPITVDIAGWLENANLRFSPPQNALRVNRIAANGNATTLHCTAAHAQEPQAAKQPDRVLEDWSKPTYADAGWTPTGTAFGTGPIDKKSVPNYQGDVGGDTERVVNSHATAPGSDVGGKDAAQGTLLGPEFVIDRNYINLWVGGGSHAGRTCVNLLVDGKVVQSVTGRENNRMSLQSIDVRRWRDKTARLQIVDLESGAWGNIGVGKITLSDGVLSPAKLENLPDYGELALAVLGRADFKSAGSGEDRFTPGADSAQHTVPEPLTGTVGKSIALKPSESRTVTFVLAWRFPNLTIDGLGHVGRHYAVKFESAGAVVAYIASNFERLASQTRLWRSTWYASSLPYWFLDRTLLNVSTLATGACYRFANGRFYAWEGVGCCAGTCTHVWHYAQAMGRLFPEIERDIRERVDLGIAFHPNSGVMGFRAEYDESLAVDGQTGTLLRIYREHQMAPDSSFLKRCWPRIKAAYDPLFALDTDEDGVLEGGQMNTLDQQWFGKVAWLSSLYCAALRAGAAMAAEMGEKEFAEKCTRIADAGYKNIDAQLFNGEYYIQLGDPAHQRSVGSYDGCQIDQVFGAGWAGQVGLPEVLPRNNVRTALKSLYKYSFLTDVGPYRESHKPGRWYAMAGEAGLLMCSWPKGDSKRASGGFDFYLNECMTGFEHQAAGHMLREGLITEGLAVVRAIHDRYHAARRNPFNEVECGDHYSRAMASYGVFLSACGFNCHGPKQHMEFGPRLGAQSFQAAYTSAHGWGSFRQTVTGGKLHAALEVKYGTAPLKTLTLALPEGAKAGTPHVKLDGRTLQAAHKITSTPGNAGGSAAITLTFAGITVKAGQKLEVLV